MPPREWNLTARQRTGLRIADYPGKTPSQARKAIATLLRNRVPCIAGEHVNEPLIQRAAPGWNEASMKVATHGVVWAKANVSGGLSSGTYPVVKNQPVCFDMTTGYCVTGVNPAWPKEEYVIVGQALDDWTGTGIARIPIKLVAPASQADGPLIGACVPPQGYSNWSLKDYTGAASSGSSTDFWWFKLQGLVSHNDAGQFPFFDPAASPDYIRALNLAKGYISAGTFTEIIKQGDKYFCEVSYFGKVLVKIQSVMARGGIVIGDIITAASAISTGEIILQDLGILPPNTLLPAGTVCLGQMGVHCCILDNATTCPEFTQ